MNTINHEYSQRGYLEEDFLYFHLRDQNKDAFTLHYHSFHKLVFFLSGDVTYLIEGKYHRLKPMDILLVAKNQIHMPIIDPLKPYERIVLWINDAYIDPPNREEDSLLSCFELASQNRNLLRLEDEDRHTMEHRIYALGEVLKDTAFGHTTLKQCLFQQLMVWLNRYYLGAKHQTTDVVYDERILFLLNYINDHLEDNLQTENLAQMVFLNKYYLMHLFKEQIGYSVHQYVQEKRLIRAKTLLRKGLLLSEICDKCGFGDYSSFVRAFKKKFGLSPKKYAKSMPIS